MDDNTAMVADKRLPWLRLAGIPWLGETLRAGLIKRFGDAQTVFSARREELSEVKGWTYEKLDRFFKESVAVKPVCSPKLLDKHEIRLVTYNDSDYPQLLREIPDSPVILFAKGRLEVSSSPHIAIVGARNGTQLGFDITREFARELAGAGFVVVSGMALGIDTFAHQGAMEGGGKTIAVLGCGPDITYPASNRRVRQKILESGGAILSEYPPGTIPRPWHFPVRNRVISGMCLGTLVVEASARSGSLITARLAAEQNRDVFAVPGNIRSESSEGTLALIKDGAYLVTSPAEIITHYSHMIPKLERNEENSDDLTESEIKLLNTLANQPISIDKLMEYKYWSREELFTMLLSLEMRDYLLKLPGNAYQTKLKSSVGRQKL